VFRRARVDGFAFDAEALQLARRLELEVVEVPVRAEQRQGSKVRLGGDPLRMLADVWRVRRAAARGAYDQEAPVRDPAGSAESSSTSATDPSASARAAARSGDRNTKRL
jgi:hypothetical protein